MKRPEFLEGVDLKKLRAYLDEDGGDGWTIWKPEKFTEMGFRGQKDLSEGVKNER